MAGYRVDVNAPDNAARTSSAGGTTEGFGVAVPRPNILEPMGSQLRIQPSAKVAFPDYAATQANGRIVGSYRNRYRGSFDEEAAYAGY